MSVRSSASRPAPAAPPIVSGAPVGTSAPIAVEADGGEPGAPLTPAGFEAARARLGLQPAALWAVMRVEAKACGFLADRRPVILFERHVFHRRTGGRFTGAQPGISHPKPGGYGAPGANQHARLEAAAALDPRAAQESASWGLGQVMGFNARHAGYDGVEAFVAAMRASEDAQLLAMCAYIAAAGLDAALRRRDWTAFARGYNGPGFARNAYDAKLAAAFADYSGGARPLPDLALRAVQMRLRYAGLDPGPVDGVWGRRTRTALAAFRTAQGERPSDAGARPFDGGDLARLAAATRAGAEEAGAATRGIG